MIAAQIDLGPHFFAIAPGRPVGDRDEVTATVARLRPVEPPAALALCSSDATGQRELSSVVNLG
jgi:hypothetical protein